MSKKPRKIGSVSKGKNSSVTFVKEYRNIKEFKLANGLTILYYPIKDTGVITTNITYKVGARDEERGQTGIAHMLEHMLFKPTTFDLKRNIDSSAMQFERETGCILNANTWKDRTTYFFSYPKEYFSKALQIEAERMHDVVLSDTEFQPERQNVLSEFDMYFGDPNFALSMELVSTAFHSHPYGHETIGFREDIERYTAEMLEDFYRKYYDPSNATLMIIGDIDEKTALEEASKKFASLKTNGPLLKPQPIKEPKQEGLRRAEIMRPSASNVLAFGLRHGGFPTKDWFKTTLLASILSGGPDSILNKKLVDSGLASSVEMAVEPTSEENIAILFVTLSKKATHESMEKKVLEIITDLKPKDIALPFKKAQQRVITDEIIGRSSSLSIAMELTEYVSADVWEKFFDTESILKSITAKEIADHAKALFTPNTMTIGRFIGTNEKK